MLKLLQCRFCIFFGFISDNCYTNSSDPSDACRCRVCFAGILNSPKFADRFGRPLGLELEHDRALFASLHNFRLPVSALLQLKFLMFPIPIRNFFKIESPLLNSGRAMQHCYTHPLVSHSMVHEARISFAVCCIRRHASEFSPTSVVLAL